METATIFILAAFTLVLLCRWIRPRILIRSLPGPGGLPILGNVLQIPVSHEWITYTKWAVEYGPVLQTWIFGQSVIIINNLETATELLEKRSSIYSDRPRLVMAGELMGWDRGVTLIPSGERHRRYRKLLQQTLSKLGSRQFFPLQQEEAYGFARRLLDMHSKDLSSNIRRAVAASIVRVAYGHIIESNQDKYILDAEDAQAKFSIAATPNVYLVDSLPFLKWIPSWFPGALFQRQARQWRGELEELTRRPFLRVKQDMQAGKATPSYVSRSLESIRNGTVRDEEDIMFSALSLYTGGADTTVSSVHTFFLAMVLYPEIQARAQSEIDCVIGADRLPTFGDREQLPYVNACVKEVFRWNPALPLGVAHKNNEADEYQGCIIPKGSTIITNIWAMMRDESLYKNPTVFSPERWLHGEIDSIQHNFGFGRRICPGMWTADATLFIIMATILSTLSISPPVDPNGKRLLPEVKYTTGMISHPQPFDLCIEVRSRQSRELLEDIVVD